jgi:hypothetical protein
LSINVPPRYDGRIRHNGYRRRVDPTWNASCDIALDRLGVLLTDDEELGRRWDTKQYADVFRDRRRSVTDERGVVIGEEFVPNDDRHCYYACSAEYLNAPTTRKVK